MTIPLKALLKMEDEINKKYYTTVKITTHYDNEVVEEKEISGKFYAGDKCTINFGKIEIENYKLTINYKKWWQFWK